MSDDKELKAYIEATLRVDISRLEDEREYVQHRLLQKREELAHLIWEQQRLDLEAE